MSSQLSKSQVENLRILADSAQHLGGTREYADNQSYMAALGLVESNLDPSVKRFGADNRNASGLVQFIGTTWQDPDLHEDGSYEYHRYPVKGVGRLDPLASAHAGARLALKHNNAYEKKLGLSPTNAELYMMHQQGQGNALKMFSADPDALASDVVPLSHVKSNWVPGASDTKDPAKVTVGEFLSAFKRKWNQREEIVAPYLAQYKKERDEEIAIAENTDKIEELLSSIDKELSAVVSTEVDEATPFNFKVRGPSAPTVQFWETLQSAYGEANIVGQIINFFSSPERMLPVEVGEKDASTEELMAAIPSDLRESNFNEYITAINLEDIAQTTRRIRIANQGRFFLEKAEPGNLLSAYALSIGLDPTFVLGVGALALAKTTSIAKIATMSNLARRGALTRSKSIRLKLVNWARRVDRNIPTQGALLGASAYGMSLTPDVKKEYIAGMGILGLVMWRSMAKVNANSIGGTLHTYESLAKLDRIAWANDPSIKFVSPSLLPKGRQQTPFGFVPTGSGNLNRPVVEIGETGDLIPSKWKNRLNDDEIETLEELALGAQGRSGDLVTRKSIVDNLIKSASDTSKQIESLLSEKDIFSKASPDIQKLQKLLGLQDALSNTNRKLLLYEEWANTVWETGGYYRWKNLPAVMRSNSQFFEKLHRSIAAGSNEWKLAETELTSMNHNLVNWLGSNEANIGDRAGKILEGFGQINRPPRVLHWADSITHESQVQNFARYEEAIWAKAHEIPIPRDVVEATQGALEVSPASNLVLDEAGIKALMNASDEAWDALARETLELNDMSSSEAIITELGIRLQTKEPVRSEVEAFRALSNINGDPIITALLRNELKNKGLPVTTDNLLDELMLRLEQASEEFPEMGRILLNLGDWQKNVLPDALEQFSWITVKDMPWDESSIAAFGGARLWAKSAISNMESAISAKSARAATSLLEDMENPAAARSGALSGKEKPWHVEVYDSVEERRAAIESLAKLVNDQTVWKNTDTKGLFALTQEVSDEDWSTIFDLSRVIGTSFTLKVEDYLEAFAKTGHHNDTVLKVLHLVSEQLESAKPGIGFFKATRDLYRLSMGIVPRAKSETLSKAGLLSQFVEGEGVVIRSNITAEDFFETVSGSGKFAKEFPELAGQRSRAWQEVVEMNGGEAEVRKILASPAAREDFLYYRVISSKINRDSEEWALFSDREKLEALIRADSEALKEARVRIPNQQSGKQTLSDTAEQLTLREADTLAPAEAHVDDSVLPGSTSRDNYNLKDFKGWLWANMPMTVQDLYGGGPLQIKTPWAPISKLGEMLQPTYKSMLSPFMTTRMLTARLNDMPYVPDVGRFPISVEALIIQEKKFLDDAYRAIEEPYRRLAVKMGKVSAAKKPSAYFGGTYGRRLTLSRLAIAETFKTSVMGRVLPSSTGLPSKIEESAIINHLSYRILTTMTVRNGGVSVLKDMKHFNESIEAAFEAAPWLPRLQSQMKGPFLDDLNDALEESAIGIKKYMDHYAEQLRASKLMPKGEAPEVLLGNILKNEGPGIKAAVQAARIAGKEDPRLAWYMPRKFMILKIKKNRAEFEAIIERFIQRVIDENPQAAGVIPDEAQIVLGMRGLDPNAAKKAAKQITDQIIEEPFSKTELLEKGWRPSSLKGREIYFPDSEPGLGKFLESDANSILDRYHRSIIPAIVLSKEMGSPNPKPWLSLLEEELEALVKLFPEEKAKLTKQAISDAERLESQWHLISNRLVAANASPEVQKWTTQILGFNYLRHGGGFFIGSLTDVSRLVSVFGAKETSYLVPKLLRNKALREATAIENAEAGVSAELGLSTAWSQAEDLSDEAAGWLPATMRSARSSFFLWEGLGAWNQGMKGIAAAMTQIEMMKIAKKATTNSLTEIDIEFMRRYGMSRDLAKRIFNEWEESGAQEMSGVALANTRAWKDVDTARSFRAILGSQTDDVILTPMAGHKPLWGHKWYGRLFTQYMTHMFESFGMIFLSDLTRREMRLVHGALSAVAMGGLVYTAKQYLFGKEPPFDDPTQMLFGAIDRSGLTSVFGEAESKLSTISGGSISAQRLRGQHPHSYAYRSPTSALGPTASVLEDVFFMGEKILGDEKVGAPFVGTSRRLIPGQNFWPVVPGINTIESLIKKAYTTRKRLHGTEKRRMERELKEIAKLLDMGIVLSPGVIEASVNKDQTLDEYMIDATVAEDIIERHQNQ